MASILVRGGTIVTMNPLSRVIEDGAVAVEGGLITGVGKADDVKPSKRAEFEIDAKGMVVVPGLVDTCPLGSSPYSRLC